MVDECQRTKKNASDRRIRNTKVRTQKLRSMIQSCPGSIGHLIEQREFLGMGVLFKNNVEHQSH